MSIQPFRPSSSSSSSSRSADFNELLRNSLSLVKHIDNGGVPLISRNLNQLELAARKLARSQPPTGADSLLDSEAQIFLAKKGVDLSKHSRLLRDLDFTRFYEPVESLSDLDVEEFLSHQHRLILDSAIEEAGKITANGFRRNFISKMDTEWEQNKKVILDSLGFRAGKSSAQRPLNLESARGRTESLTPTKRAHRDFSSLSFDQLVYYRVVHDLNQARKRGIQFKLAERYIAAANEIEAFYSQQRGSNAAANATAGEIGELFEIIRYLIGECGRGDQGFVREKQFASAYESGDLHLRQQLIAGAKRYNEELFLNFMKSVVHSQSHIARLQGRPGILPLIHGFLNCIRTQLPIEQLEPITVDGFPLWCTLFYCLRVGQPAIAVEVAERAARAGSPLSTLIEALRQFHYGSYSFKPSADVWERLSNDYNREITNNPRADPFKVAVYHLIGRFKLSNPAEIHRLVADSAEDYIWLKLSVIYEDEIPIPDSIYGARDKELFTLRSLQDQLLKRGEQHFSPDARKSLVFFRILLFSQQFEAAIHYLVKSELFPIAVQVALTLDYYGLLRRTEPREELFKSSKSGHSQSINLYTIVRKYVDPFLHTNPEESFHYFYALRHSELPGAREAVAEFLKDLILETKEYELLIGTVKNQQLIKSGCIYQLYEDEEEALEVVRFAAQTAERSGLTLDAIELFTLAHSHGPVCSLLLQELARFAASSAQSAERQQLIQLASRFLQMNASSPESRSGVPDSELNSLGVLWEMVHFFDLYQLGPSHYDDALDVLSQLNLFPLTDEWSESESKVAEFQSLHPALRRVFASVALALMEIYYAKFEYLRREGSITFGVADNLAASRGKMKAQLIDKIRVRARAFVNFVGMNQIEIGAEIHAKLIKLEALMA